MIVWSGHVLVKFIMEKRARKTFPVYVRGYGRYRDVMFLISPSDGLGSQSCLHYENKGVGFKMWKNVKVTLYIHILIP